MTIKIQAFQRQGIKSDKCEDRYEFCCWEALHQWLHRFARLNKCLKCKAKKESSHYGKICEVENDNEF